MPRPERIDCVLFDCDGVLIDSEPIAARRNVVIFGELGIPATFEDCLTMCGQDGKTTIPAIGAKYGATSRPTSSPPRRPSASSAASSTG